MTRKHYFKFKFLHLAVQLRSVAESLFCSVS